MFQAAISLLVWSTRESASLELKDPRLELRISVFELVGPSFEMLFELLVPTGELVDRSPHV